MFKNKGVYLFLEAVRERGKCMLEHQWKDHLESQLLSF